MENLPGIVQDPQLSPNVPSCHDYCGTNEEKPDREEWELECEPYT